MDPSHGIHIFVPFFFFWPVCVCVNECSHSCSTSFTGRGRNRRITKENMTLFPDSRSNHENYSVTWQRPPFSPWRGRQGRKTSQFRGSLIRSGIYAEKQFVFRKLFRRLSIPSVSRELLIQ